MRHSKSAQHSRSSMALNVFAAATVLLDLVVVGLIAYEHYSLPTYVWVMSIVSLLLEAIYVAVATCFVKGLIGGHGAHEHHAKRPSKNHADLGVALVPFWSASLMAQVTFWWAYASSSTTTTSTTTLSYIQMGVSILSLLVGLAFGVLAMRNHLLQMGAGNRSTGQQSDDEDGGKGSDSTGAESGSETDESSKSTRSRKR